MRRWFAGPLVLAALLALAGAFALTGLVGSAASPIGAATTSAASAASAASSSLPVGRALRHGQKLVSPSGRYVATVDARGRVVVRSATGAVRWRSPAAGPGAYLLLGRTGLLSLRVRSQRRWSTGTAGSGRSDRLTMRDDGVLALTAGGLTVWSTALPYACPNTRGKVIVVDLSRQWARMCQGRHQLRATFVTTGASARGHATPTGTWRVNSFKQRNTTLRPATGGAFRVRFWLPYDGNVYGLHDSSWQQIPYGSARYGTHGSHGCVHVPLRMMQWTYGWASVGTRVTIHA